MIDDLVLAVSDSERVLALREGMGFLNITRSSKSRNASDKPFRFLGLISMSVTYLSCFPTHIPDLF